jgi:hypothetical protein
MDIIGETMAFEITLKNEDQKKKKNIGFYRDGPGLPCEDSGVLNFSLRIWTINGRIACTKRVQ